MKRLCLVALPALFLLGAPPAAYAWGNKGHMLVAAIAWRLLTPGTQRQVTALLAQDTDTLTGPNFIDRATWADAERSVEGGHGVSHTWHYVSIPPGLTTPDQVRSALEANEAIAPDAVSKVREFEADLKSSTVPTSQKILALKFLIHLVGDLSQPLHTTADAGGNCITVSYGRRTSSLHQFWDDQVVYDNTRSSNPIVNASSLGSEITPQEIHDWSSQNPADWAVDSYAMAMNYAYRIPGPTPTCHAGNKATPILIDDLYRRQSDQVARLQLQKAAVRLAFTLNSSFTTN